jgi:alkylation response protein AidB-like acyl-CoA dehydrogenase
MTQLNEAGLGSDAMEVLEVVERFARDEVRPLGARLDELCDPEEVIAADSPLWALHEKYRGLGVDTVSMAGMFDPLEQSLLSARIMETLGWADAGLAVGLAVSGFQKFFVPLTGDPALTERYMADDAAEIGCWAVTEPDHGSDSLGFSEPHWANAEIRPNCIARRDGDEWVIKGSKSAWVSNGPIATVAALFCTIDGDEGFSGGGVCLTPLDLPGVSRGKNLDKLGQRALPQGELHFDDVRVPAANMVVGKELYSMTVEMVLAVANAFMGSTFAGLARSAYELALDYAKDRVQGGVPIIEHQNVRARLFKMFAKVEAATSLSRRTHLLGAGGPPPVQYSIASKTFCTTTAFEVASEALQIFGGNGLTKEYPIEKVLRDARAAMIEDGCNEMLSLIGGSKL